MDNELLKDTVLKLKDRIIKTEAWNIQLSETDTRQGLINPLFRALQLDFGDFESIKLKGDVSLMRTLTTTALAVTLTVAGLVTVAGQELASRLALNIMALSTTTDVSELRLLDARVDALVRTNALVLASQQPDVSLSGRVHETFQQYHAGVPVYGGGISRQLANTGLTVSIFGTI